MLKNVWLEKTATFFVFEKLDTNQLSFYKGNKQIIQIYYTITKVFFVDKIFNTRVN